MFTAHFRVGSITLAVAALLPHEPARSEPPKFTLNHPVPRDNYFKTSSIALAGQVDPPIRTDVRVQLFHVLENGELLPEGGATCRLDAEGRFSLTLHPRAGGWTPGTLRCVVTAGSHLLRKTVDVNMLDRKVQATTIREPRDSGVVVDLTDLAIDTPRVPAGEKFRVRRLFHFKVPPDQHQGPAVRLELLRPNATQPGLITAQADIALSFPVNEADCEFESEIVAPDVQGAYYVRVVIPVHDAEGQLMEKQYDADLIVGPPSAEPGR